MIQSKEDYNYYLYRDRVSSNIGPQNSVFSRVRQFFYPNYEWKFIQALRYLEYCENVKKRKFLGKFALYISKIKFRRLSIKLGYSIPINVFGPGISLPHRGNIIINPKTQIGENCRIHVGVNIGAHNDKAPCIGNNVYIGPGAIIFGGIEITDNVSIGANATVNKSILESNTVVVGTPATVVKRDVPSWNGILNKVSLR